MKEKLALLVIAKKNDPLLAKCLKSSRGVVDEIIVEEDEIQDLGKKRRVGLGKVKNDWVLVLDTDEVLSKELRQEIAILLDGYIAKKKGYLIPFQNHFLGKAVNFGGENYQMLRLFRKDAVTIDSALVHEGFQLKKGKPGLLKNKIYHYSYRSLRQMYKKFTDYALREAKQKKLRGEKSSLKKIFLYPIHMFWARYVEDKGYKDGFFRIPLDLGFAYMELLTYIYLGLLNIKSQRTI